MIVFTIYPEGPKLQNDNNVDVKITELKKLAKEQVSAFFDSPVKLVTANKPTMVLLAHEVDQVRELLCETITSKKQVAKIPRRLQSYELVLPCRFYMATRLSSLTNEQVKKLSRTLDEDIDGIKSGAFNRLNDEDLTKWSNNIHAELKEVNWFVELNAVDLEKISESQQ
ncbi:hypothetical protein REH81_12255 [Vibrio rotiferianus]